MIRKIQTFIGAYKEELLSAAMVTIVAFAAFGFGRATSRLKPEASIAIEPINIVQEKTDALPITAELVASKNGKKYYFPTCSGVKNIKSENLIGFATEEEARDAGYTPAKKCQGL